jgi:hypothetical protein
MTLEELREAKSKTEKEIYKLIRAFESDAGEKISGIYLDSNEYGVGPNGKKPTRIKREVVINISI